VLAETTQGTVIASLDGTTPERVLQAPGTMITFLQAEPSGKRVAIGRTDGLEVVDLSTGTRQWHTGPGPVRCVPAWSPDGTELAAVLGESRGLSLFAAANGQLRWVQRTAGWPVQLQFHPAGRLLACATDEPAVLLCDGPDGRIRASIPVAAQSLHFSDDGSTLTTIDGAARPRGWRLEAPVGFREWNRTPQTETDGTVFKLAMSPDGRFLLSTATAGIRIWSVAEGRQTGFHPVENQRIDAPTGAWWLGGDTVEILVQVPGGLERVPVDPSGRPGTRRRVPRQPGTTVIDVTADGTWLVSSIDPEAPPCEAWRGGDPATARAVPLPAKDLHVIRSRDGRHHARQLDDVIKYSSTGDGVAWKLVPPERLGIRDCVFSMDGDRLFVLGREHRLFVWDLGTLREELARRKF
jgi:WD40 repeat protein